MESASVKRLTGTERLRRYAQLVVRVGANVAGGQYVLVDGLVEFAPLVRELADAAYAAGARFVDVRYADLHVKHSMIDKGADEVLTFTPDWMVKRLETAGAEQAAQILVAGNPEPTLFADLDQGRVGRARSIAFDEAHLKNINTKAVNWTIAACPTEAWAELVYGERDLERLWSDVGEAVRLDEDDPVAAWEAHIRALDARATSLNEARFDAIQFEGPGTDLTVGLLPGSRWRSAASETSFGRRHVPPHRGGVHDPRSRARRRRCSRDDRSCASGDDRARSRAAFRARKDRRRRGERRRRVRPGGNRNR